MRNSILCILFFLIGSSFASDHIDGVPSLERHEQVDLTDLYAFIWTKHELPSAHKKKKLKIILNLYPGVSDEGHFSEKVSYDIIIREANSAVFPERKRILTEFKSEIQIQCSFKTNVHGDHSFYAHAHKPTVVNCAITKKNAGKTVEIASISGAIGNILGNKAKGIRLFTGPRADAFFINDKAFKSVVNLKDFTRIPDNGASNVMEDINILSIALEVDLDLLFGKSVPKFLAIAAHSFTRERGFKEVLDRVGRPEMTNLSMHKSAGDKAIKQSYNELPVFYNFVVLRNSPYHKRLVKNITKYDLLDNQKDWSKSAANELVDLLMDDYLVLNTSDDCQINQSNNFFEIERSLLNAEQVVSCGGRYFTDDIMATLYALYIGGTFAEVSKFETGVPSPYSNSFRTVEREFPYLAEPKDTGFFQLKRFLLNNLLKKPEKQD